MSLSKLQSQLEDGNQIVITSDHGQIRIDYFLNGKALIAQGWGHSLDEAAQACLRDLDR